MTNSSNQDLLDLQEGIKMSLRFLEEVVFSPKPAKQAEKKKAFLILKQRIRTLLRYSEFLQSYADSSYESSVRFQRKAAKLAKEKAQALNRLQDWEAEAIILQKKAIEQERMINEMKMMNQLDAFYISSISFDGTKEKAEEEVQEFSENSEIGQSRVSSYYSVSRPGDSPKAQETRDCHLSTSDFDLSQSLEFMTVPEIGLDGNQDFDK